MRYQQRGVTLLETILAVAIIGWVLTFVGTQLLKRIQQIEVNEAAAHIVYLQAEIKRLTDSIYLRVQDPTTNVISTVVNPNLIPTTVGKIEYTDLNFIKKMRCIDTAGMNGLIPDNALDNFISCDYKPNRLNVRWLSTHIEYVHYNNLMYLQAKRFAKNAWSSYVHESNTQIGDFINLLTEITNVKSSDGHKIIKERVYVAEFTKTGVSWEWVPSTEIPLETLISDIPTLEKYLTNVTSGGNYPGFFINALYEEDIDLKRDGSIPIALDSSLCWDNRSGVGRPCIRAITDAVDNTKDVLVVDTNLVFGAAKKKTPIEASYHTFTNAGSALKVPFLNCVSSTSLNMENKMAAVSSSYSAGNEATTDFTNPEDIISSGTVGASGKHALVSGTSLEWRADVATKEWIIEGAIGFDAQFESANNGKSVLINPKSMSFIVLQWCEEK